MENSSQISNIFFGALSLLSIISGFLFKGYQFLFWIGGAFLLVVTVISYYLFDTRSKIMLALNKLKKVEEALNIYDRLNMLELRLNKMSKKGQINIMEIIKWILAIILIFAFFEAISSLI